jgi:hypothetical protein
MKAIHLTACGNADLCDLLYAILGPGLPNRRNHSSRSSRAARASRQPQV